MALPIMAKATAVWLVDNTTLSFKQISDFCGLHELEVQGIADGEVAAGIKGFDPIANKQLTADEIKKVIEKCKDKLDEYGELDYNLNIYKIENGKRIFLTIAVLFNLLINAYLINILSSL